MIKCCLLDIKNMDDPAAHPEWQPLFSENRWKQISSYAPVAVIARKECAGAGLLLKWMFTGAGIPDGEERVYYGIHNKPLHKEICFNISHSSGQVLCTVSDRNVGCDIQEVTNFKDNLLNRICDPKEYRFLMRYPDLRERDRRATGLWAMKESILKYTGDGIFKSMDEIYVDLSKGTPLVPAVCTHYPPEQSPGPDQEQTMQDDGWRKHTAYPVYIDGRRIREKVYLYEKGDFLLSLCTCETPDSIKEVNLTTVLNKGII